MVGLIAVDTNVLVYAYRPEPPEHAAAVAALDRLHAAGSWAIPWTVAYEFLSVVTQPRIWRQPATPSQAVDALGRWTGSGGARLLAEGPRHQQRLSELLAGDAVRGSRVFDARVAATCLEHGVRELWTVDRDFSRFPGLRTANPLAG